MKFGSIVLVLGLSWTVQAQTAPALAGTQFFGGPGDQTGNAIVIRNNAIFISGNTGQVVSYGLPPAAPLWSHSLNGVSFPAVTMTGGVVYLAGWALPPSCGAVDNAGDVEPKSSLAQYESTMGGSLGCASANFFTYQGTVVYSVLVSQYRE